MKKILIIMVAVILLLVPLIGFGLRHHQAGDSNCLAMTGSGLLCLASQDSWETILRHLNAARFFSLAILSPAVWLWLAVLLVGGWFFWLRIGKNKFLTPISAATSLSLRLFDLSGLSFHSGFIDRLALYTNSPNFS